MAVRCSAQQVAEAVLIWSAHKGFNPVLCLEYEDTEKLKCLDMFLSTVVVFSDAFFSKMKQSFVKFQEQSALSKSSFIEYLKPRALLLANKSGYFDLILTCTFFSRVITTLAYFRSCFHFARVACKLLTRILEDRFGQIFETDSGWERLVSYCKSIHAVVFPSEKNRPPGYEPCRGIDSGNSEILNEYDDTEHLKKTEIDNGFKDEAFVQNELDLGRERCKNFLNLVPITESSYSCGFKLPSENNKSTGDDATYCRYFRMDCNTICERITYSKKHLDDVNSLLKMLEQDIDANFISSARYDVSISDDEYIENLEKDDEPGFYPEQKIVISYEVKDCFAKEICEKENSRLRANSKQYRISPGDITYEEVVQHISNMCSEEDDNPKCELCFGKMHAFINNWEKSFHEKYSNSDTVTDVI